MAVSKIIWCPRNPSLNKTASLYHYKTIPTMAPVLILCGRVGPPDPTPEPWTTLPLEPHPLRPWTTRLPDLCPFHPLDHGPPHSLPPQIMDHLSWTPLNRMRDTCENITLPRITYVVGNKWKKKTFTILSQTYLFSAMISHLSSSRCCLPLLPKKHTCHRHQRLHSS